MGFPADHLAMSAGFIDRAARPNLTFSKFLTTYAGSIDGFLPSSSVGASPSKLTGPGISETSPNGTLTARPERTTPLQVRVPTSVKYASILGLFISAQHVKFREVVAPTFSSLRKSNST